MPLSAHLGSRWWLAQTPGGADGG